MKNLNSSLVKASDMVPEVCMVPEVFRLFERSVVDGVHLRKFICVIKLPSCFGLMGSILEMFVEIR